MEMFETKTMATLVTALPQRRWTSALGALAVLLGTAPALAHDLDHHRLEGDKVKIASDVNNVTKAKFSFKTKGQIAIHQQGIDAVDPTIMPSNLIVRGTGVGDANTGVIYLDPAGWKAIGTKGYRYTADFKQSSSDGVRKILVKTGKQGGSLKISAKGQHWGFDIVQPQQSVQIALTINDEV